MKSITFTDGTECYRTLSVAELIAELSKFAPDLPVLAYWETLHIPLSSESMTVKTLEWHAAKIMPPTPYLELYVDQF